MNKYSLNDKWVDDLNTDLIGSDRSCAVLGGAVLDDLLKELLTNYLLPPSNKKEDRLLGRAGFIDSFAAKIELARRLNLISEEKRKALDWVRGIRNEAAHKQNFNFNINSIKDCITNTVNILELEEKSPSMLTKPYDGPKGNYVVAVIILAISLKVESGEIERTKFQPTNLLSNFTIDDKG